MNAVLDKDAIIINGKVYILVDDETENECERCDLFDQCFEMCADNLCKVLTENNGHKRFQNVGDLIEMKIKV